MSTITQYNFKIEEALKEKIEEVLEKTDLNKGELLEKMLQSYEIQLSTIDTNIDFKEIDFLSQKDKEAFQKAFLYGIRKIEENTSRTKQEYIYIDTEKKSLIEKEELQKAELEKMKLEYLESFNALQEKNKNLSSTIQSKDTQLKELQIELSRVSKVSEQVEFISGENSSLRLDLKAIELEKKDIEISRKKDIENIEVSHQKAISSLELSMKKAIEKVENEKKDIQTTMKKELHSVQVELKNIETSHKKEMSNVQEHIKALETEHIEKVSTLNETILKSSFEIEKKNETILRIEKNNVEFEKSIKGLQTSHTKDIQAEKKKNDSEVVSLRKELDSIKKELYLSMGKLEVLQEKKTQKVVSTKKEKTLFEK